MKVVVVGSGGREHALAWVLERDGAEVAMIGAVPAVEELAHSVLDERPDLVVVGPETPLVAGLADVLRARGVSVFGPSREAARLEGSKAFAKAFMLRHGVPTADHRTFDAVEPALAHVRRVGAPIVVKDSGLAAGKGVTVARTLAEAEAAIESVLGRGGGAEVVVEECLIGRELTVMLLTDGHDYLLLPPSRDHKRLQDGDVGEMTGGMGAVAPAPLPGAGVLTTIEETIVRPALAGVRAEGMLYRGVLYVGLMLTESGPKVLEFNVRFGDPEAQAVLPLLASNSAELFLDVAEGRVAEADCRWLDAHVACVVMAAPGYPEEPVKGVPVGLPEGLPEGVMLFPGGLEKTAVPGEYRTTGGRALSVVALAPTEGAARAAAYATVKRVRFEGAQYRTDIGL